MPVKRKPKTIGEMQVQIKRIARGKDPQKMLKALKAVPAPKSDGAPIEQRILTVERAPLITALGKSGYKRAAKPIFDYTKKTRLTSERAAGIEALGNLGFKEAIPFIKNELVSAQRWLDHYGQHRAATNVHLVRAKAAVCRSALKKLEA